MSFRRREPIHRRLAREGGLDPPRPVDLRPWWGEVGIHGVPRPREWDAVVTTEADLTGDRVEFTVLADGTHAVAEEVGDVEPLASAVERSLTPPYRAEAIRRPDGTWAVAASRIRVERLTDLPGDDVTLTAGEQGLELAADGERRFGSVPALEALLPGPSGVVHAVRIAGDAFEITVHAL